MSYVCGKQEPGMYTSNRRCSYLTGHVGGCSWTEGGFKRSIMVPHVCTVRDRIFDIVHAFDVENIEAMAVIVSLPMVERLYAELLAKGLHPTLTDGTFKLHMPCGDVSVYVDPYAADDFVRVLPPFTRAHQAKARIPQ